MGHGVWVAGAGTLAYGGFWFILGPGNLLPTWATVAYVGAYGVFADGGTVTLMLPRTALIHIWGHKEGVRAFPVSQSLVWYCYSTDPWWPHSVVHDG